MLNSVPEIEMFWGMLMGSLLQKKMGIHAHSDHMGRTTNRCFLPGAPYLKLGNYLIIILAIFSDSDSHCIQFHLNDWVFGCYLLSKVETYAFQWLAGRDGFGMID